MFDVIDDLDNYYSLSLFKFYSLTWVYDIKSIEFLGVILMKLEVAFVSFDVDWSELNYELSLYFCLAPELINGVVGLKSNYIEAPIGFINF